MPDSNTSLMPTARPTNLTCIASWSFFFVYFQLDCMSLVVFLSPICGKIFANIWVLDFCLGQNELWFMYFCACKKLVILSGQKKTNKNRYICLRLCMLISRIVFRMTDKIKWWQVLSYAFSVFGIEYITCNDQILFYTYLAKFKCIQNLPIILGFHKHWAQIYRS